MNLKKILIKIKIMIYIYYIGVDLYFVSMMPEFIYIRKSL